MSAQTPVPNQHIDVGHIRISILTPRARHGSASLSVTFERRQNGVPEHYYPAASFEAEEVPALADAIAELKRYLADPAAFRAAKAAAERAAAKSKAGSDPRSPAKTSSSQPNANGAASAPPSEPSATKRATAVPAKAESGPKSPPMTPVSPSKSVASPPVATTTGAAKPVPKPPFEPNRPATRTPAPGRAAKPSKPGRSRPKSHGKPATVGRAAVKAARSRSR